jgi:glycerol-3-phosphate dehydrogenase
MYDIAIIGAGVIGTGIARELMRYQLKVVMLEMENDVADGTTKANSAIVHAGYDAPFGSKKARFNVEGNAMYDQVCEDLDVRFKRIGSLVLAFDEEDRPTLEELLENGKRLGVPDLEIIEADRIREIEPNVSQTAVAALYASTAGIVGPWELAISYAENAMDNGAELRLNTEVTAIEKKESGFVLTTSTGEVEARLIVNAAGIHGDEIYGMVAESEFTIKPRRGEYFLLDNETGGLVNTVVFQCPTKMGKGVLVSPTVDGNIIVGPNAEDVNDRNAINTTADGLAFVREKAQLTIEDLPFHMNITNFSGLRAEPSTGDFIVEESKQVPGFVNAVGIKSPGLSCAPAIAVYVAETICAGILGADAKKNLAFNPKTRKKLRFEELSDKKKVDLIRVEPSFARIICRCETITEGEIVDAIHRNAGARTVNGVKRRCRPGAGRCQGGFCGPRVVEILARELKISPMEVELEGKDSHILVGETKGGAGE